MPSYIDTVQAKRNKEALIKALKGNRKPGVAVTLPPDLKKLTADLAAAISGIDQSAYSEKQLVSLHQIHQTLEAVEKAVKSYETAIERQTVQIVAAIRKIELAPNISVNAPATSPAPVQDSAGLSNYRGNDQDDAPDGTQYFSFLAMDGSWYIVHATDNGLRYHFGKNGYETAWNERYSLEYKVLNEAIHGVSV